jgi:hypothetical protein
MEGEKQTDERPDADTMVIPAFHRSIVPSFQDVPKANNFYFHGCDTRRDSDPACLKATARAHGWGSPHPAMYMYIYTYLFVCLYAYVCIFICGTQPPPALSPLSSSLPIKPLPIFRFPFPVSRFPLPISPSGPYSVPLLRTPTPQHPSAISVWSWSPGALNSQLIQRFIEWQCCSEYNHSSSSRDSLHSSRSSHSPYPTRSYDYPAPSASLSRALLAPLQLGSTLAQVTVSLRLNLLPTTRHFFPFVIRSTLPDPYGASRFTPLVW